MSYMKVLVSTLTNESEDWAPIDATDSAFFVATVFFPSSFRYDITSLKLALHSFAVAIRSIIAFLDSLSSIISSTLMTPSSVLAITTFLMFSKISHPHRTELVTSFPRKSVSLSDNEDELTTSVAFVDFSLSGLGLMDVFVSVTVR